MATKGKIISPVTLKDRAAEQIYKTLSKAKLPTFSQETKAKSNYQGINLACGIGAETKPVSDWLKKQLRIKAINFLGLDNDSKALEQADGTKHIKYELGDAADIKAVQSLLNKHYQQDKVDCVVLANPYVDHEDKGTQRKELHDSLYPFRVMLAETTPTLLLADEKAENNLPKFLIIFPLTARDQNIILKLLSKLLINGTIQNIQPDKTNPDNLQFYERCIIVPNPQFKSHNELQKILAQEKRFLDKALCWPRAKDRCSTFFKSPTGKLVRNILEFLIILAAVTAVFLYYRQGERTGVHRILGL